MNKQQRTRLESLVSQIEEIAEAIREMQEEEQDKFDNLSDGLQQTERGQLLEEGAGVLDEAASSLEDISNELREQFAKADGLYFGNDVYQGKITRADRADLQSSLVKFARRLGDDVQIVKQTKNTLIASHGNETATYFIK